MFEKIGRYAYVHALKSEEEYKQKLLKEQMDVWYQGDSVLTAQIPRVGFGNFIGEAVGGFDVHEKINFIQLFNEVADKAMEPDNAAALRLDADRFLYLWMSKEKELMEELS